MTTRVGINGFGRIGRQSLKALIERTPDAEVVAVNDLMSVELNALLFQRDSTYGAFDGTVEHTENSLIVNGKEIKVLQEKDPAALPWGDLGVDVVYECTGLFRTGETAGKHIAGGAKKVIISAPGGKDIDATVVYGVNHDTLKASDQVISNASCTPNCLAPLVKPLHEKIGVKHGIMTTIHAYTNDQVLTDVFHKDLRRARSATMSMIPTKTGAAAAVGLVLPELNGKLDGFSMRVPTINVSAVDLSRIQEAVESILGRARQAASFLAGFAAAQQELEFSSPGLPPTKVDAQGRLGLPQPGPPLQQAHRSLLPTPGRQDRRRPAGQRPLT